jgi:copper(I)-binding protein
MGWHAACFSAVSRIKSLYRLAQMLVICIVASAIAATTACASQTINITQAWSRATPKGSSVAAGYLTIENRDGLPDRLLEVRSTFAKKVELHTTVTEHGITSMRPVKDGLPIPATDSVTLKPGGSHLMFGGLNVPFVEGGKVAVELIFEKAGKITANLDIAAIGSLGPQASKPSPKQGETAVTPRSDDTFFTHLCGEKLMANVTVSPARTGDFEVVVELEDEQERPLAAQAVAVTLFDEKRQTELITADAERISDEKWRVKMSAPTPGTWLLSLNVKTASVGQVEIAAPILIE